MAFIENSNEYEIWETSKIKGDPDNKAVGVFQTTYLPRIHLLKRQDYVSMEEL